MKCLATPNSRQTGLLVAFAITAAMLFAAVIPGSWANAATFSETEDNGDYTVADFTQLGATTNGAIKSIPRGWGANLRDYDWFKFKVPCNGVLTCTLKSNSTTSCVAELYEYVDYEPYRRGSTDFTIHTGSITQEVSKGTYYLRLCQPWNADEKISYSFKLNFKMTEKPSITSLKSSNKKIKAKWSKASGNGYQVRYSTSKSMKNAKNKFVSSKKFTSKKLKKGKKYYVQVRAYSKSNGKTYYSSWSKKKKIVISK